jgi:pSer/pThr/pTyr-binding forkhead associated (FHA) protein
MAVRLVPMGDGPPIRLDRPIVFVGRHADCDVRIDSKKISRRHCCFVQLTDRLLVRDLGSTNGVYCNGQRVEEAVLSPQDEVQIANYRYQVVVNDLESPSPSPGSGFKDDGLEDDRTRADEDIAGPILDPQADEDQASDEQEP